MGVFTSGYVVYGDGKGGKGDLGYRRRLRKNPLRNDGRERKGKREAYIGGHREI